MRRVHQQVESPIRGVGKGFPQVLVLGGAILHGVPLVEILVGVNRHLAKPRGGIKYIIGLFDKSVKKLFQRKQMHPRVGVIFHGFVSIVRQGARVDEEREPTSVCLLLP